MQNDQNPISYHTYKLEECPTYRIGNLTISQNYLAFTGSKEYDKIIIYELDNLFQKDCNSPKKKPFIIKQSKPTIYTSIAYNLVNNKYYLFVTSILDIWIYSENGQKLILEYPIGNPKSENSFIVKTSTIQANDGSQCIVIVLSNNTIFTASIQNNEFIIQMKFRNVQVINVSCVESSLNDMMLFVCYEDGKINILDTSEQLSPKEELVVSNYMITCCKSYEIAKIGYLCCGDYVGGLTILNISTRQLMYTISAHVRFITGLSFINGNTLVSYSEDTKINFWNCGNERIQLQNQAQLKDQMIFAGVGQERSLILATYDQQNLIKVSV